MDVGLDSKHDCRNILKFYKLFNNCKTLSFTGGEPTLLIDELRRTVCELKKFNNDIKFSLLTNGSFGKSIESTAEMLNGLYLSSLQVSYDRFHSGYLSKTYLKNIKQYCEQSKIEFHVAVCISSPEDLIFMSELESEIGIQCKYQILLPKYKNKHFEGGARLF